jgi:hypothetical protein
MAIAKPKTTKVPAPAKTAPAPKSAAQSKSSPAGNSSKVNAPVAGTPTGTGLPPGFVSPFKRVEMQPGVRIDDGLAAVAALVGRPLDEVMQAAIKHGLPPHGPAWVYSSMLIAILRDYGIKAEEKDCPTLAALPDVAMITADYNPATQYGRWVLWHHVRGTDEMQAFNYIHDGAHWVEERYKTTTDVQRLITPKSPIFYLECIPAPTPKGKGAAK